MTDYDKPMHTPEPWKATYQEKYRPFNFGLCYTITTGENRIAGKDHVIAIVPRYPTTHAASTNAQRIVACVNACQGIPTEWLEQFGRSALVRSIHLVPADKVGGVAEVLSGPLKPSEQVIRVDVCPHCKSIKPVTDGG